MIFGFKEVGATGLVMLALTLSGCSTGAEVTSGKGSTPPSTLVSPSSSSTESLGMNAPILVAGEENGLPTDRWVLRADGLIVTRDDGTHWERLPLPITARTISDVAVLHNATFVASVESETSMGIYRMGLPSTAWEPFQIPLRVAPGHIQLITVGNSLVGAMVTEQTSTNFSLGTWLSTSDGGSTWHEHNAPVGGRVFEAGGALWLVGGVQDQSLYISNDNGTSWGSVRLPLGTTDGVVSTLGHVFNIASGNTVILTATETTPQGGSISVRVLQGKKDSSGWKWDVLSNVPFSANYGPGVSVASSIAGGVLWILTSSQLSRLDLATNSTSTITPSGLPPGGNSSIFAISATSAWATVTENGCLEYKSQCYSVSTLSATQSSGKVWSPISDPLG